MVNVNVTPHTLKTGIMVIFGDGQFAFARIRWQAGKVAAYSRRCPRWRDVFEAGRPITLTRLGQFRRLGAWRWDVPAGGDAPPARTIVGSPYVEEDNG